MHAVNLEVDGRQFRTLADLIPDPCTALCIGINPAPASVAAGHYYQGALGQRFFSRLVRAGLYEPVHGMAEDDVLFARGVGFTDLVKRPTARASDVEPDELHAGVDRVEKLIQEHRPVVLLFVFKQAAVALLGRYKGHGWIDQTVHGASPYVMPGPYASRGITTDALRQLHSGLADLGLLT